MPFTYEIEQWLEQAGYEYHCFLSYPRATAGFRDCAERVKTAIEEDLGQLIGAPKVFIDDVGIEPGNIWEPKLQKALCRSVAMVALCAQVYYHPSRPWCGREWAAMEALSQKRLAGRDLCTIIPLIYRETKPMPAVAAKVQYIDISNASLLGRSYYRQNEFRKKIRKVVEHIEAVAEALSHGQAVPECTEFEFPAQSAFAAYQPAAQPAPFRSGTP